MPVKGLAISEMGVGLAGVGGGIVPLLGVRLWPEH